MQVKNIDECFLRLDLPDFQDIGVDDARPAVGCIGVEDLVYAFIDPFPVVVKEIVNIGDLFDRKHLQVLQPVDADQEPVVSLLVDQAAVERVFIEDARVVDDGAAVIIVVEVEDSVKADGVAQAEASDDIPELREQVIGIICPDNHFEVDGEEEGMHGSFEDHETAVAGADKGFLDLFLRIFLEDELVVLQAKADGFFEKDLEQRRDQNLLEMFIQAIAVNIYSQHCAFIEGGQVDVVGEGFAQVFAVGDDVDLVKDGFRIVMAKQIEQFVVVEMPQVVLHGVRNFCKDTI